MEKQKFWIEKRFGAKEIAQVLKAINALGTTIIVATHNDKVFSGIKGVRKIHIKPEGVVVEGLKGIVYSKPNEDGTQAEEEITPEKE
jgi:ABC-type lipoprotein export system ATPase subunit